MATSDWVQLVSLVAVVAALLLNARQNREVARQTRELTRQTQELTLQNSVFLTSMQQNAYLAMVTQPAELRISFLKENPELLAWHLAARGYRPGGHTENLRRLYVLLRLDMHELNFVNHGEGLLTDDVWTGWSNVLKADFSEVEFREAWQVAKHLYAPSFVVFVDQLVGEGTEIGKATGGDLSEAA